jgi:hypothetical protein
MRLRVWNRFESLSANSLAFKANDLTAHNPGAGVKPGDVLKRHKRNKRHKRHNNARI